MNLNDKYKQADFLEFSKSFLPDFKKDIRKVSSSGHHELQEAFSLGRSEDLDLQVFEFHYSGSGSKRVALTKDAFQIMKLSANFRALAVFHGLDEDDWRLSLMTANPEKTEKGKVTLAYSNPRRYSFFLGPNARINTPYRFLVKQGTVESFDDLLSRFNVEIVTKEFFEHYKKLFDRLLIYLNKDNAFKVFANSRDIEPANFAKKLLGQIVFLYFLQRKGWLGAKKGESISAGNKNFLRILFERSSKEKANFYNTYLEHLFYGALNRPPEKAGSYFRSYFDCQIPFLNGGLFEPPQGYDWEKEFLVLPDDLFSNNGDGILDIFDLYNFTVDESDFLDKEVSVDPEMLGKVFENLLEENMRKGKGTYYTPREIVNYMCEESLVNYLATVTGLVSEEVKNKYFPAYNVLGDEKVEVRDVSVSEKIIKSLINIKVIDLACGSGAFLVGMLQQITQLRYDLEGRSKLLGRRDKATSEYEIKKQTIQNCIYGVDIDPGAIEIAKLRLWLSLVVDYDLEDIEPLPNLDYKLMVGNSLIEKLDSSITTGVSNTERDRLINLFKEYKDLYFLESDSKKKAALRHEINELIRAIVNYNTEKEREAIWQKILGKKNQMQLFIRDELNQQSFTDVNSFTKQLEQLKDLKITDHFEWNLNFNDVFENGGFDVVIANPPYVDSEEMVRSEPELRDTYRSTFLTARGNWDLFVIFIEKGINLLKQSGTLIFIIPNKIIGATYTKELRKLLLTKTINEIRDYSRIDVFTDQDVYPVTLLLTNRQHNKTEVCKMTTMNDLIETLQTNEIKSDMFYQDIYWDRYFFNKEILKLLIKIYEIEKLSTFISDIQSAATVSEAYKIKNYLFNDQKKVGYKLINTGTIDRYESLWGQKKTQYIKASYQFPKISPVELIKINQNRNLQAKSTKVIIAGMSNKLEAFLDERGEYLAGKSTSIILANPSTLTSLVGLLNSKLITFFVTHFYHSLKMAGGYLNIEPEIISNLPIPPDFLQSKIGQLVKKLISLKKVKGFKLEKENLEKQIDQLVYKLYDLTPEEIATIEYES